MRFLTLLALLVFLAVSFGCSKENQPREPFESAHYLQFRDGDCSGVAVGPSALLTATHCFTAPLVSVDGKPVRVVWRADDGRDHTLLGVSTKFAHWVTRFAQPVRGEPVAILGNPADERGMFRAGWVAGSSTYQGHPVVLFDMDDFFGDSGAGIFNRAGQLVGIIDGFHVMRADGVTDRLAAAFPLAFTAAQWRLVR